MEMTGLNVVMATIAMTIVISMRTMTIVITSHCCNGICDTGIGVMEMAVVAVAMGIAAGLPRWMFIAMDVLLTVLSTNSAVAFTCFIDR